MESKDDKAASRQRAQDRHKAIAMTRAIEKVTDEFIENFKQTNRDTGPDGHPKPSPVRDALAARDQREAQESAENLEKPAFRGFAALMANANNPSKSSAFARLLEDDPEPAVAPAQAQASTPAAPSSEDLPQLTADGAIIKVKDTVGKKRGLYTSCMQRPTAEQFQDMAVKYARPDARSAAEVRSAAAPQSLNPGFDQGSAQDRESWVGAAGPAPSEAAAAPPSKWAAPSPNQAADSYRSPPKAPIVTPSSEARPWTKYESDKSASLKSQMTAESSCPIACGFGRLASLCQKIVGWCKGRFS
jgi:hypothetical protein